MAQLRNQLVRRLEALGVEHRVQPGRDDGFSCLIYRGKEFAHFHTDNELDLRLTKHKIRSEKLVHPVDSRVHPNRSRNSQWIVVRFMTPADLERIVDLVQLAMSQIHPI